MLREFGQLRRPRRDPEGGLQVEVVEADPVQVSVQGGFHHHAPTSGRKLQFLHQN
jgi:hypothetical protein